jgi:hypothetical protein
MTDERASPSAGGALPIWTYRRLRWAAVPARGGRARVADARRSVYLLAVQLDRASSGPLLRATVTPLASIFGSGFLIIVPVLERGLGGAAVIGVTAVCALAWVVGSAVRHNVLVVEPLKEAGTLDEGTRRLEWLSDALIVVAYIISVALYLRIMAQYVVAYVASPSETAERVLTTGAITVIAVVGLTRGFRGLSTLERLALGAVLAMTAMLGAALFGTDIGSFSIPPATSASLGRTLLLLGGVLITVQGFETVRYLTDRYDRDTRVNASRLSQVISAWVYISLVALATPLMADASGHLVDRDLLDLIRRAVPALALPLVLGAVLSQFSAAVADTVAAHGNLRTLSPGVGHRIPYLLTAVAASILSWSVDLFTLVVIASRAFAAYYCVQALVAMRTSERRVRQAGFAALSLVLLGISLFAEPVG